jgi:hypothetical protein
MGIIDEETYQILEMIRKLRNRFAHTPDAVDLSDERVDPIAALLSSPDDQTMLTATVNGLEFRGDVRNPRDAARPEAKYSSARRKFMSICVIIWCRLVNKTEKASGREPPAQMPILTGPMKSPEPSRDHK